MSGHGHDASKTRSLTPLEGALAHNNGIELLNDRAFIARLEKGDASTIADAWFQAFTDVHRRLYRTRSFNHDSEKPGIIGGSKGRIISPAINTLVKQLYDAQGFAKNPPREKLVRYLSDAYSIIAQTEPFSYGNLLTLRTFFVLIGKTGALTDDKGHKLDIDFTRLNQEDLAALALEPTDRKMPGHELTNRQRIDAVFDKLLDPNNKPEAVPSKFEDRWEAMPSSEAQIVQKHFLSHKLGDTECLVTLHGGLVPRDTVEGDLTQHINRGGHPADFTVSKDDIIGFLIKDGRENQTSIDGIPFYVRSEIDGTVEFGRDEHNMSYIIVRPKHEKDPETGKSLKPIEYPIPKNAHLIVHPGDQVKKGDMLADDAIPLFPLNVDLLTGLDVTTQLPSVKEYCKAHHTDILKLPEYVETHELPDNLASRLLRAARRVKQTRGVIRKSVLDAFAEKTPIVAEQGNLPPGQEPMAFMTMGGTGSGKSNLEEIAAKHTGNNYVKASLDDARSCFSIYDLYGAVGDELPPPTNGRKSGEIPPSENSKDYIKTGHHSGDYIAMETAASYIREGIVEYAKGNQNVYLIPGETPEHKGTGSGSRALYHLLYDGTGIPYEGKNKGVIQDLSDKQFKPHVLVADAPIETAYDRALSRLRKADGRAVPPKVIVDKHRGITGAVRDASRDEHVHHFTLLDTTGARGEHYVLARRYSLWTGSKEAGKEENYVKKLEIARKKSLEIDEQGKRLHPRALFEEMKAQNLLPTEEETRHAPPGWEERVEFFIISDNHQAHLAKVLVLTDHERMTKISQKGALNPNASGRKDLYTLRQPFETRVEESGKDISR